MYRIGHRGAAGYEPENTLRSFRKAIDMGVDMIELDIHRCASGEIVVHHDDRLERTTDGSGYVAERDYAYLRSLDAGKGERIPLLEEVIELADRRVQINIEIKGRGLPGELADLLRRSIGRGGWSPEHFIVSGFNHRDVKSFGELLPAVRRVALVEGVLLDSAGYFRSLGVYGAGNGYAWVDSGYVEELHQSGLRVLAYTVDHPDDIERMIACGIDGIFSNYPDRLAGK